MNNLVKPYKLAVYTDKMGSDGTFVEERICIIGSDQMTFQGRALDLQLTRNINGQNKLTFKMYKRYTDIVTGEEEDNPFIPYLISERKVKLQYGKDDNGEDIWYDFIIKDISENSSTYLYTYSLEDAIVQELSKNGFGTTLDSALMNNIGNSESLGKAIMSETDWNVEAEKIVETTEEALVYIKLPKNQLAWHICDQTKDTEGCYSSGVTIEDTQKNLGEQTVLAFYSSCKNKPHRFQFIYSDKGYNIEQNGCISRQDDRLIDEDNCQYYIDFDNPEVDYTEKNTTFDFYLPTGFNIDTSPSNDTTISSNYRGKRYAYAPQAIYVPLLDKYCSRFEKKGGDITPSSELYNSGSGKDGIRLSGKLYTKNTEYSGIKITIPGDYQNGETYKLSYTLTVKGGQLYNIGGHSDSFLTNFFVKGHGSTKNNFYSFSSPLTSEDSIEVEAYYLKKKNDSDSQPYLFIQPNRGLITEVKFSISDLCITSDTEYLSYVDTEYVSPALIQNYINNYNFDSTAGWIVTSTSRTTLNADPKITNCYGRFIDNTFRSMIDDFLEGKYSEDNTYTAYMQVTFTEPGQFVLNSGLRDNRSIIGNLEEGTELIVDCGITTTGTDTVILPCSIGEYKYNQTSGGYDQIIGLIGFSEKVIEGKKAFEVISTSYTKETFKKDSKLYLRIDGPDSFEEDDDGNYKPKTYYIKKALLYKKALTAAGNLIVPDYDAKNSSAAEDYVDNSVIKNIYNYFPRWLIDYSMVNNVEEIPLKAFETLTYTTFKPIYNDGAEKIRTVSVKESNYFNNLQTLAETFEQWLTFEIGRNDDGSIYSKKVYFKNYCGKDNYACFRYGVNLQDIQRTYASKNIVTKLIVKNNSNEHAKNGFCTIQRAGTNPTGENYLYDFQYYQNQGIMPVAEYLNEVYYVDPTNSMGPDCVLWSANVTDASIDNTTLKGYFPRIKKINEALFPINTSLANKKIDLLSCQSQEEVAKSTYDAALSSIGVVREDFKALTGIYPEEAQDDKLKSISVISAVPQDSWYEINGDPVISGNEVGININVLASNSQVYPTVQFTQGVSTETVTSPYVYKITKGSEWDGIYLDFEYANGIEYILEYDLTLNTTKVVNSSSSLINIGCHNDGAFSASYSNDGEELPFITVTRLSNNKKLTKKISESDNTILNIGRSYESNGLLDENEEEFPAGKTNSSLHVTLQGTYNADSGTSPYFWIQPNRGTKTPVTCTISNIRMYVRGGTGATTGYTRKAYVDLTVGTMIDNGSDDGTPGPNRKYTVEIPVPAGEEQATATQIVAAVDTKRSDVRKYLEEYTVYHEKLESSTDDKTRLASNIATLNTTINNLETQQKDYLSWKQKLNQLFFKKYSRFIQEGTWINEECVDDEKYYTDAQSVLYNSCYPQVAYTINVLELSRLPGYELFTFNVGEKTWVIDDEFFGTGYKEEVIIAEIIEKLDDPSQNKIIVQNFKNQFQDLFQKITATVQQTQYNSGSYEKGAALMEANDAKKSEFITNAINSAASFLAPGKNHTVTWEGGQGITVTDDTTPTNQVRIVGGAILFSAEDPDTKEQTWVTGVTNQGISANLITAGRLDTGAIQIMSGTEPVFRWDAYGISAYDAVWYDEGTMKTISGINSKKFVRFDKNGIYGINSDILGEVVDGANWHPSGIDDIDQKATFALTWEGLKVTGSDEAVARLGKIKDKDGNNLILSITKGPKENPTSLMSFSNDGTLTVGGWSVGQDGFESVEQPAAYSLTRNATNNTEGDTSIQEPKIFLSATGRTVPNLNDTSFKDQKIVFKAGDNFYVTDDGAMYAKAGKIGDMEIGNLTPNKNLVINSQTLEWTLAPSPKLVELQEANIQSSLNELADNTTITISFDLIMRINTGVDDEAKLQDLMQNAGVAQWPNGKEGSTYNNPCPFLKVRNKGINIGLTQINPAFILFPEAKKGEIIKKRCSITTTITRKETEADNYIQFYSLRDSKNYFFIKNLKIEEGTNATPYILSDGETSVLFQSENLLYDSKGPYIKQSNDTSMKFTLSAPIEQQQVYTLSFDTDMNSDVYKLNIKLLNLDMQYNLIDSIPATGRKQIITFYTPNNIPEQNSKISLNFSSSMPNFTAQNVKLEKGFNCSNWSSEGDLVKASQNNNYSWKFLSSEGMYMWNGPQQQDNIVFAINEQGLYVKGNGEFDGTIKAKKGEIGGFKIQQTQLCSKEVYISPQRIQLIDGGVFMLGKDAAGVEINSNYKVSEDKYVKAIIAGKSEDFIIAKPSSDESDGKLWGAGIRFKAQVVDQEITKNIKIEVSIHDGSLEIDSHPSLYLIFKYKITDSEGEASLSDDQDIYITVDCDFGSKGVWPWTWETVSSTTLKVHIPKNFNNGVAELEITSQDAAEWDLDEDEYAYTPIVSTKDWALLLTSVRGVGPESLIISSNNVKEETQSSWTFRDNFGLESPASFEYKASKTYTNNNVLYSYGSFCPDDEAGGVTLGDDSNRWAGVVTSSNERTISDIRLKNSIQFYNVKYETLFDLIQPKLFKYNDNTSDRLHSGFIAQEIEQALIDANLTTKEFAGLCIGKDQNNTRTIRYSEFIPLNTWQIQKLKPRVSALEQTIIDYEARISNLETEIQNLKNQ